LVGQPVLDAGFERAAVVAGIAFDDTVKLSGEVLLRARRILWWRFQTGQRVQNVLEHDGDV
jgi:hypothetical protein